jgi:hypothetical protein
VLGWIPLVMHWLMLSKSATKLSAPEPAQPSTSLDVKAVEPLTLQEAIEVLKPGLVMMLPLLLTRQTQLPPEQLGVEPAHTRHAVPQWLASLLMS